MKKLKTLIACGLAVIMTFTACGRKGEINTFKKNVETFCTNISTIDTAINNIDATSENATDELLHNLDVLNNEFQVFAGVDFPEEFDYLEPLAKEASTYMTEAVNNYHLTYQDENSYDTSTAEYAKENYARAYKRIQIIIAFLHGDDPAEMGLIATEEE